VYHDNRLAHVVGVLREAGAGPERDPRLGLLADVARALVRTLDPQVIWQGLARGARDLLGAPTVILYRLEPETGDLLVVEAAGELGPVMLQRLPAGVAAAGRAVRERQTVATPDVLSDSGLTLTEEVRAWVAGMPHRAALAVPMVVDGTVVGVFAVGREAGAVFDGVDVGLVEALAGHAAMAVRNAQVYMAERRLRSEAELLASLAPQLTASLDLDRVLHSVAEAARDIAEADVVRLALRDATDGAMRYRYLVGTRASGYERLRLEPGRGFVGRVLETGRPYRAADAAADAAVHPEYGRSFIEAEGVRTVMVVPVRGEEGITGLIYTARRRPRPFSDEDERVVSRLAEYAAIAIRNAQLHAEAERQRREAEATERRVSFLAQASVLLSASLDVETTLRNVARLAVPFLADFCTVDMADERGVPRRAVAVHADPAREALVREVRERHGFKPDAPDGVPRVLSTGRTAFVSHVTEEHLRGAATSEAQLALLRALGIGSWIIVPLVARGLVLGAITLVMAESGRHYGVADVGMAEDLGRRAALAIENAQLYREAQQANQAKDQFLATLSHELRTPINAVYGWARMLRDSRLDAEARGRGLEAIERNARAQVQLIDDLLDVSRIISGKLRLDVRPVDVATVVEAALDAVRPAAGAKGVRLHTVLDPRTPPIMGDPDRLQQVVWNLLTNAVKFTPRGGRVEVTLRRASSHLELLVADTGCGIEPDLLPHLFERFRQGDPAHGGLGIGLALARHLAELHGGTVVAASGGAGQGATFTVRLPVGVATRLPRELPEAALPAAPGGAALAGVDVLVVDDDPDALELLRVILTAAGASVRSARSVAEALGLVDGRVPDVVVSDVEMPGEDGYALVRRLRQRPRHEGGGLPVVALTGYSGLRERIRALEAGFDMHITKPADPVELTAVLVRLVRRA
jgi:signal transduction histidine kinase/CheY-like chemotaxis protein/putative methionine-R-sulfoxide reductase with GAF domain